MTTSNGQSRATTFASTATTVVALLAIASAARVVPVGEVLILHDARPAIRESAVVRAVAVAVAAAKDMFGVDHTNGAFDAADPVAAPLPRLCAASTVTEDREVAPGVPLDERLLDLPPPLV